MMLLSVLTARRRHVRVVTEQIHVIALLPPFPLPCLHLSLAALICLALSVVTDTVPFPSFRSLLTSRCVRRLMAQLFLCFSVNFFVALLFRLLTY